MFQSSAPATSADAAPPKPLSRATICGMPVIGYLIAISPPTTAPMPAAIPTITSAPGPALVSREITGPSQQAAIKAMAMPAAPR